MFQVLTGSQNTLALQIAPEYLAKYTQACIFVFPLEMEKIENETARVTFSPLNKDAKVQEAGNANILPTKELSYSISFNATDHEM